MKRILFFLWLSLPIITHAQQVVTLYPTANPNRKTYTAVSSGGSTSFTFYFPGTVMHTGYTGFCEVVAWVDSVTSGSVGDRDSLTVSIEPLMYDIVTATYQRSSHADRDSLDIVNIYAWGTTDSDSRYDFNVSGNLPACNAARVNVYAGSGGQCTIRVELRITYPYGM